MNLARGVRVLRKRYELVSRVRSGGRGHEAAAGTAETWLALGLSESGREYLLCLRPHRDGDSGTAETTVRSR